jgi:hypothetical protein
VQSAHGALPANRVNVPPPHGAHTVRLPAEGALPAAHTAVADAAWQARLASSSAASRRRMRPTAAGAFCISQVHTPHRDDPR